MTTGLDDFGGDAIIEPLDLLIHDFELSADLNLAGKAAAWVILHRMLSNRLRLVARHQSCNAGREEITQPIFILGLPRTGSTMLHETLACHPDLRAPLFWETNYLPDNSKTDKVRQLLTSAQVTALNFLSPGFQSVHKLETFSPHECVTIQASSLRSMQFHAAHRLSSYNEWLNTCDWNPAYKHHKQYLQLLQLQNHNSVRWVLKAPGHLLAFETLVSVYPDARFVMLHRDPCEVIPSMCSLSAHLRKPFSSRIDPEEIGADITKQWLKGLQDTMRFRRENPQVNERCLDVYYQDLVHDPIETVSDILAFADVQVDETQDELFRAHLVSNPKNKHGNHHYSLSQFGLRESELKSLFAGYNEQYGVAAA